MTKHCADDEIAAFFRQAMATRAECDERALTLAGGAEAVPVGIQGVCSYTVFAGDDQEFVIQFRLRSLELPTETTNLARAIYGDLAPEVTVHGQLGDDTDGEREPLLVYVMRRIRGISQLDFILAHGHPENSPDNFAWRKTLMIDVAGFAWHESMYAKYRHELELLLGALPERFHGIIRQTIDVLTAIVSLPAVLLHEDFSFSNIIVSEPDCHLVGVVDWAEAAVGPFGTNLHSFLGLSGKLDLRTGVVHFEDHAALQETFWDVLSAEVGGLSDEEVVAIKWARVLGLLRWMGFRNRLANIPKTDPIGDDDEGRYNMLYLDGLLLNPLTKFD